MGVACETWESWVKLTWRELTERYLGEGDKLEGLGKIADRVEGLYHSYYHGTFPICLYPQVIVDSK